MSVYMTAHSFDLYNGKGYFGSAWSVKFESPWSIPACVRSEHSREPDSETQGLKQWMFYHRCEWKHAGLIKTRS